MTKQELIASIKKNPVSYGCGLLSLALAAAIYFRSDEIPAAEANLAQKSAEAERYALNIKNAAQLKEQFDALAADNKTIESRMVRLNQLAINQQYFQVLRRETGVNLVEFRQNTGAAGAPKGGKTTYVPVAFSVSVQGSFPQVLGFLRALESGTHYCRILTATWSGGGASQNGALTLALSLELLGLP